jgi:translation initiation factor 3 subunit D
MKIGYVSRQAPINPNEHFIFATQFVKPKDFASQINLNINNIWGIIKMICELLLGFFIFFLFFFIFHNFELYT